MRLTLFFILFISCSYGQNEVSKLKLLGSYSWEKTNKLNPEPLQIKKTVLKTKKIEVKEKAKNFYSQKIKLDKKALSNKAIIQPAYIKSNFISNPITENEIIKSLPFIFKDNSGFNLSYSDKSHGFPSNNTVAITEDNLKNIWIATADIGLIKYDGINYYIYNKQSGLPSNEINDIAFDAKSNKLWVATSNGIVYIKDKKLYTSKSINNRTPHAIKIYIDPAYNAWICTKNMGAIKYSETAYQLYDTSSKLPSNYVLNVLIDSKKNTWFTMWGGGVVKSSAKEMIQLVPPNQDPIHSSIYSILEKDSDIWLGGFSTGLIKIAPTDTVQYSITGQYTERIYGIVDAPKGLYLSIYGYGLGYISNDEYFLINGTAGKANYYTFKDSYGNVWMGDLLSGISRLNENTLSITKTFGLCMNVEKTNNYTRYYFMNGAAMVKETKEGMISMYNELTPTIAENFFSIDGVANEDESVWATTYGNGVCLMNEKNCTFYEYSQNYEENTTLHAERDVKKRTWFGTLLYGLVYIENDTFFRVAKNDGLLTNVITSLGRDAEGHLFCGYENGVQKIIDKDLYTLKLNNKPFQISASNFLATKNGTHLIGTSNQGLMLLINNNVYSFGKEFKINAIYTIIEDAKNNLWLATNNGIVRINSIIGELVTFKHFDISYGVNLGKLLTGVYLTQENTPCWSTESGMLMYNPIFEQKATTVPKINFISASVNDTYNPLQNISSMLSSDALEIKYNVIMWGKEPLIKLYYTLVRDNSSDTTFIAIGEKGVLKLANIQEGEYSLIILAKYSGINYYSEKINFVVNPFWYNSKWFKILILLLFSLSIIFYFNLKGHKEKKRKLELEKLVTEKTAQLISEKLIVEKQNVEKDALIQEIHHRVKNNLQSISIIVELQMNIEKTTKTKLNSLEDIYRRISAMALVHEMLYSNNQFTNISAKTYFNELISSIDEMVNTHILPIKFNVDIQDINLNVSQCISLGMITSEAISNSIKHAFKGHNSPEVTLNLYIKENTCVLEISDNGCGYNNFVANLGTKLIHVFVKQLRGNYNLKVENGVKHIIHFNK